MIDTSFLDQLNKFQLILSKRITSNYSGARISTAHGRGIVLKDYRIYVPGDDFRAIDWKVFARTDKLHIKKYEEERSLSVHVIIDSSASMDYGNKITKFEYASMLGIGFAFIAMKQQEKFQYATFSEKLHYIRPKRGMHQLAGMIEHMNKVKPEGVSMLDLSLQQYRKYINSKSYIVLISDFLLDINQIKKSFPRLGEHEIIVLQVLDRKEIELGMQGDLRLHDSETNSILRTFMTQRMRQNYQNKLKDHIMEIEKECLALGYKYYTVPTDENIFDVFWKIMSQNR